MELTFYALFFAVLNLIYYKLGNTQSFMRKAWVLVLLGYIMVILMIQYHKRALIPGLSSPAFFLLMHFGFTILLVKFLSFTMMKRMRPHVPGQVQWDERVQAMYQQVIPSMLPIFITVVQWVLLFTGWAEVLGIKMLSQ